jgi:hypothetical protein
MNYVLNTLKNNLKFSSLIIFCLFIGNAIHAQEAASTEKVGKFAFETDVIDYGTIPQNADGVRVFKFTNVGEAPIVITNAKGSCGCTVPTYSKNVIEPGATGEISVKYATNRIGKFTKTVTLTSNASEPAKVLRIKGEVLKPEESNN